MNAASRTTLGACLARLTIAVVALSLFSGTAWAQIYSAAGDYYDYSTFFDSIEVSTDSFIDYGTYNPPTFIVFAKNDGPIDPHVYGVKNFVVVPSSTDMIKGEFKFREAMYKWDPVTHTDNLLEPTVKIGVNCWDPIHRLQDPSGANWLEIGIERPGYSPDAGATHHTFLKVRTSSGLEFRSKQRFLLRETVIPPRTDPNWHKVEYFISVQHRQVGEPAANDLIKIRLKTNGLEQGMISFVAAPNTVDVASWQEALYGMLAPDYAGGSVYKMRDIVLNYAVLGDFPSTSPAGTSYSYTFPTGPDPAGFFSRRKYDDGTPNPNATPWNVDEHEYIWYPVRRYDPVHRWWDEGSFVIAQRLDNEQPEGIWAQQKLGFSPDPPLPSNNYYVRYMMDFVLSRREWLRPDSDPSHDGWSPTLLTLPAKRESTFMRIGRFSGQKYISVNVVYPGILVDGVVCHRLKVNVQTWLAGSNNYQAGSQFITAKAYRLAVDPVAEPGWQSSMAGIALYVYVSGPTSGKVRFAVKERGASAFEDAGCLTLIDARCDPSNKIDRAQDGNGPILPDGVTGAYPTVHITTDVRVEPGSAADMNQ